MSLRVSRDPLANPETSIRRVYSYVAYRLGDGPDAEDVTSEVFERALRYRESYDPSKGDPTTWLLGIARRCMSAFLAHRVEILAEVVDLTDERSLEEDSVRRLVLADALALLGERDQELIALRFGADLSAAQIARILDARTNAVEVALHRALDRLRRILAGESEQGDRDQTPKTAVGDRSLKSA